MRNIGNKILTVIALILVQACGEKLPVIEDISTNHFAFVNSRNEKVLFPGTLRGKLVVMNFIYTNCPDICPLSTNNMRLIQEKLLKKKLKNVEFVSLSFDPSNDTPEVLSKFAEIRNLNLSNWMFLTGSKKDVDSLIKNVGVMAVKEDSTTFKGGRKMIFFTHTDRISLIDTEGKIRKNYSGSKINIDEIIKDIEAIN